MTLCSRVTLRDVAAEADVSPATASKALNGRSDIGIVTSERVRKAAQRLGYRAQVAKSQISQVAVVSNALESLYTVEVINGIMSECLRQDVLMSLSCIPDNDSTSQVAPFSTTWFSQLSALQCWGIIVLTYPISTETVEYAHKLGIEMVIIDPIDNTPEGVPTIGATNWAGGLSAVEHLLQLGHKDIAYVRGPEGSKPGRERHQGYLSALQSAGIAVRDELVLGNDFSYEEGVKTGRYLFSLKNRPTGVFAGSDITALGVIEAAREARLRVPEDVSIVGFDNTSLASTSSPRLTTVHQPLIEMGATAMRTLSSMHRGEPINTQLQLTTQLVIGDSTGPVPGS